MTAKKKGAAFHINPLPETKKIQPQLMVNWWFEAFSGLGFESGYP